MARTQLNQLKQEINHYLGIPYMINILKDNKVIKERFLGAKGNWQQIDTETKRVASLNNVDLNKLTLKQKYNFQKKYHIGIDCSGLVSNLLIFYGSLFDKKIDLDIRHTSANLLTSEKLSRKIVNPDLVKTGDMVRQKDGHHVLFVIEKINNTIYFVESSLKNRKVTLGQFDITNQSFDNQGIYRLLLLD